LFVIARLATRKLRRTALSQHDIVLRPSSYRHTISLAIAGLAALDRGVAARGH
jgi:hypothetical protein